MLCARFLADRRTPVKDGPSSFDVRVGDPVSLFWQAFPADHHPLGTGFFEPAPDATVESCGRQCPHHHLLADSSCELRGRLEWSFEPRARDLEGVAAARHRIELVEQTRQLARCDRDRVEIDATVAVYD